MSHDQVVVTRLGREVGETCRIRLAFKAFVECLSQRLAARDERHLRVRQRLAFQQRVDDGGSVFDVAGFMAAPAVFGQTGTSYLDLSPFPVSRI